MRNLLVLLLGALILTCTGPVQAELVIEGDLLSVDVGYIPNPDLGVLITPGVPEDPGPPVIPAVDPVYNIAGPFPGSTTYPDPAVPGSLTIVGSGGGHLGRGRWTTLCL